MTANESPTTTTSHARATNVVSLFGDMPTTVTWTSPPLELHVKTVPGFDWNAVLTNDARLMIAQMVDEAELDDFTFEIDDEQDESRFKDEVEHEGGPTDAESAAMIGAFAEETVPYYFAALPGTVRWTSDGVWACVSFSPGEDWRSKLKQAAVDEATEWTTRVEEHDVEFRLDMDYRHTDDTRGCLASASPGCGSSER